MIDLADEFDETTDIALEIDEIPTIKVETAGIASAMQLIDTTSDVGIYVETMPTSRTVDKDFLKMSEEVMKKVWDNKYDDVWDSA